jgi:hypothetical protein
LQILQALPGCRQVFSYLETSRLFGHPGWIF